MKTFPKKLWALIALSILIAPLVFLYSQIEARAQIDNAQKADVIIVLGSAVYPGGRASPSLAARTQHAIQLYRAGYAPTLILSGGANGNLPSEAEVMRRLATNAGIPADALLVEDQSHSTQENLVNSKRILDARGGRTALIVSDAFHLYRAETMARDLGMIAYGSPANSSPASAFAIPRAWYTAREALALVWYYATRPVISHQSPVNSNQ
ncbi:MAG: YdcF family protein [Chloroflexi bacterium]|nr:YdcF family protein [Chloroflexota bacterium]